MENYKITITTTPYIDGVIEQITDFRGELLRQVMNTREHQIRQALIQLGWTPPDVDVSK